MTNSGIDLQFFTYDIIFNTASAELQVEIYVNSSGTNHKLYHITDLNAFSFNSGVSELLYKLSYCNLVHISSVYPESHFTKPSRINIYSMKQILRTSHPFHKNF
jgi:hypothetical protein